jgi:hypothetical protein
MRYELTEDALNFMGNILIDRIRKEMLKKQFPYGNPNEKGKGNKVASGSLLRNLQFRIEYPRGGGLLGTSPGIIISSGQNLPGKNYNLFDVVSYGVDKNRASPPVDTILGWIKMKGIRPRDKWGRFLPNTEKNTLSLAWAVKTNIFKYGIRPANLLGEGKRSMNELFQDPPPWLEAEINNILVAVGGDIENFFDNIIEK